MTSSTGAQAHEQDERQIESQLRDLEARLIDEYAGRGANCEAKVHETLATQIRRFADARVRTFLPILIERATRAELATQG